MAAAGSAVGLGNIWKFPYEVGKGGGAAFLFMYLAFCFILCFPVLVAEISIGRKTQKNAIGAFRALGFPKWSIIGRMGVASGVLILSFYNIVAGWAFGYFVEMIMGNFAISDQFGDFIGLKGINAIKVVGYSLIFMVSTTVIVSKGISGGIERAARTLMPMLVLIIVTLILYSLTLPNAMKGIEFYLVPDFTKINFEVVYTALSHAFFSLSLGMGALITYGSYVSKTDNILSSAAYITLADIGIAFIAGLMIFPFVFSQNIDPQAGAGLVFVTLPKVFATLGPLWGPAIGGLFFLLLSFAALTSTVSLLEVPVSYVVDEHKISRKKAVWLTSGFIFLVGIPSLLSQGASETFTSFISYGASDKAKDFLTLVEDVAINTILPLGGVLITIFTAYVWKTKNLTEEISFGNPNYEGSMVMKFLNFALTIICPIILSGLFVLIMLSKFVGIELF